ncbi:hypothetical protein AVHY2522_24885 [Acidovorax sp. SUPP2522]|uniref:hypothetical protein n=2 Tax=unclassified Acidovorax TaxID=2684926 RepID=UPI0023DE2382|nr:hypothetical protein [Acidovorax sp. SUPP2522]GKT20147.1 hypothetical protein AVHY2522_24885 [Acidovorax sp. SUPP2522]
MSFSPPRASNRPRPSSSESSSMAPRGAFFSPSSKPDRGHTVLDSNSVAGGGGDRKMNAQIERNAMAARLQKDYPDGLPEDKKKSVKSGSEFGINSSEGKKVYNTYKTMLKES